MAVALLLVEDNEDILANLYAFLEPLGYELDCARNGRTGLAMALEQHFDCIVLDIMLPGIDGICLCRELRDKHHKHTPIIMLTARDAVADRVQGLEAGADDYLVKPFAFSELLARVRTLLRRGSKAKDSEFLLVADLELDLLRRRATRGGQRIDLTAKEFALLELLMRRRGEVLPRSLIASQVWDMNFDSDTNVIEVAVRRLRAKVDDGFSLRLIRTVRGMGYVLDEEAA